MSNINIALVGNPNCGKTALFNALTGSKQKVANYAGVTVEKKHGYFTTQKHVNCTLIDLPGTYSLRSRSPDEKVTRDIILNQFKDEDEIDLVICVIDATNIHNGLRLVLELKQTGKPVIVAFNMMDVATNKGYHYDIEEFKRLIACDVIPTTAIKKHGIIELVGAVDNIAHNLTSGENTWQEASSAQIRHYHAEVSEIVTKIKKNDGVPSIWSERIDKLVLHPVLGLLILLTILFVMFQAVFTWAEPMKDVLQGIADNLQGYVLDLLPNTFIGSLLGNGVIAGAGAVIVFIPQILIVFLFIIILEDTGYMSRAAFLMDKLMGGVGLHGRAFIPLLSSFACAIPGIMATRTIENRSDRLITMLISPLMTCSARLPVYTLLIGAFIPATRIYGIFNLQGLVMFALYFAGIFFGLLMAFLFKKLLFKGDRQPLIMELPSYKIPSIKNILIELIKPAKAFLRRAGGIIVAVMIVLWFLCTFPLPPQGAQLPPIDYSIAGAIGKFLHPIFAPIGFSWEIVVALIPGMAAREVAVAALGTIYALSGEGEAIRQSLTTVLQHSWSLATALSLLTWYIFAPQCIATLATIKREANSWKWMWVLFSYQLVLAYAMSYVVYNIFS